jgi:hypothetical protein
MHLAADGAPVAVKRRAVNFPSIQMLSACWVVGKIRMRLAADGAKVTVNRSTKVQVTFAARPTKYTYRTYQPHLLGEAPAYQPRSNGEVPMNFAR